jgi:hypothetical protein
MNNNWTPANLLELLAVTGAIRFITDLEISLGVSSDQLAGALCGLVKAMKEDLACNKGN